MPDGRAAPQRRGRILNGQKNIAAYEIVGTLGKRRLINGSFHCEVHLNKLPTLHITNSEILRSASRKNEWAKNVELDRQNLAISAVKQMTYSIECKQAIVSAG